jgi:hypothetical protein
MARKNEKLFDKDNNPAPKSVFKQELVTWEETESGLVRKSLTRHFKSGDHHDSYVSEPMVLSMAFDQRTNGEGDE